MFGRADSDPRTPGPTRATRIDAWTAAASRGIATSINGPPLEAACAGSWDIRTTAWRSSGWRPEQAFRALFLAPDELALLGAERGQPPPVCSARIPPVVALGGCADLRERHL